MTNTPLSASLSATTGPTWAFGHIPLFYLKLMPCLQVEIVRLAALFAESAPVERAWVAASSGRAPAPGPVGALLAHRFMPETRRMKAKTLNFNGLAHPGDLIPSLARQISPGKVAPRGSRIAQLTGADACL
jgi:hypothetical protein